MPGTDSKYTSLARNTTVVFLKRTSNKQLNIGNHN